MIRTALVVGSLVAALIVCGYVIERAEQIARVEAESRRKLIQELDRQPR